MATTGKRAAAARAALRARRSNILAYWTPRFQFASLSHPPISRKSETARKESGATLPGGPTTTCTTATFIYFGSGVSPQYLFPISSKMLLGTSGEKEALGKVPEF